MMAAAEKYTIHYDGRSITRPARRNDAHTLARRLGDAYTVWNRHTRRQSKP